MPALPQYVSFVLTNASSVKRWDLLQINSIADDARVDQFLKNTYLNTSDPTLWAELDLLNNPVFPCDDMDKYERIFDTFGPAGIQEVCRSSILSAIRRPRAVKYVINNLEWIDYEEFAANPFAISHIATNPELIPNKGAITRNPAALG